MPVLPNKPEKIISNTILMWLHPFDGSTHFVGFQSESAQSQFTIEFEMLKMNILLLATPFESHDSTKKSTVKTIDKHKMCEILGHHKKIGGIDAAVGLFFLCLNKSNL